MINKRNIPFFNYPELFKSQKKEILTLMEDVMGRGAYIMQKDMRELEENIARFLGVKHVLAVADGTNGLMLALRALELEPDDEVIMPSHTFVATASAVHDVGATPVLVECGPDHMVDSESMEGAITSKTKALMPVHLNGRTCNMDAIQTIADRHGIPIIEEAAQALGSKFDGKNAGTYGAVAMFSCYPAKLLGCFGDGGLVVTNDDEIARKVFLLRDHGRDEQGEVITWGTNCRMDNIQAAVLNLKLKTFDQDIERRRKIAGMYDQALGEIDDLLLPPGPESDSRHFDVYQNYEIESSRRDELRSFLDKNGVKTIIQWGGKAVHQLKGLGLDSFHLPFTESMFERCFLLPMHVHLSDEDVVYICDMIREFYGLKPYSV